MNLQVLHQVKIFSMILQLIWVKVFFYALCHFPDYKFSLCTDLVLYK